MRREPPARTGNRSLRGRVESRTGVTARRGYTEGVRGLLIFRRDLFRIGVLAVAGALLLPLSTQADWQGPRPLSHAPDDPPRTQAIRDGDVWRNNLPMIEDEHSIVDWLDMLRRHSLGKEIRRPRETPPVVRLGPGDFGPAAPDLQVRWLGHSTVWIEIEGRRVLADPIWSNRASPVGFAGPKRFWDPLIPLENLPTPDAVIISHDHYDHLDKATVLALATRGVPFFVPLGVGGHLLDWGVPATQVTELAWWEEVENTGLRLVALPARHFSGRTLWDRNRTLWASWAVIGHRHRVYFGGDSGLFPGLSEIGQRLGPFDITMLDSGAYNHDWRDVHMGPEQAVLAHRALQGDVLLPIHWGLFQLSFHAWTEPGERMHRLAADGLERIALPRPGALLDPSGPVPARAWWPSLPWKTAEQAPVASTHIPPGWLARYAEAVTPGTLRSARYCSRDSAGC